MPERTVKLRYALQEYERHRPEIRRPEVDDIQALLGACCLVGIEDADPRGESRRSLATAPCDLQAARDDLPEMGFGAAQQLLRRSCEPRLTVVAICDSVEVVEEVDGSIYARRPTALAQDHTLASGSAVASPRKRPVRTSWLVLRLH